MGFITFTSDFGLSDHYVAAVKARILQENPQLVVIDISHLVEQYNLAHGSFLLRSVFREFPAGTVHLIAIDTFGHAREKTIAVEIEKHFFVSADNGIISLLSEQEPNQMVAIEQPGPSSFPARDVFAPAAAKIASGVALNKLGSQLNSIRKLINRQLKATKKQISGHVVRVDGFGNLITNIEKKVFDFLSQDKQFLVQFGRENSRIIHEGSDSTEAGDCYVYFNTLGFLEIGINKGNASELLGLGYDSAINIYLESK
jgi:S-adenosylmethionine hydrolase